MKNRTSSIIALIKDTSNIKIDPNMKPAKPSARKAAMAKELLEKYAVPDQVVPSKKSKQKNDSLPLTNLQKELLEVYALEPSEQQMAALKAFLAQLFSKTVPSQTNEAEIMA